MTKENAVLIIYNPVAGRGRAKHLWPEVIRCLDAGGIAYTILETSGKGHALEIARAESARYSAVVAAGGDGTAHEVANGLLLASGEAPTKPFGIIPLGNGDDFVKMIPPETGIGSQPFPVAEAIEKIARRRVVPMDACRAVPVGSAYSQPRYFINGMNVGFSAMAGYNFSTLPHYFTGFMGYLAAVLKTLWNYPVLKVSLTVEDNEPLSLETTLAAFMNGRCFGRSFWVAPQADVRDGKMEIMVVRKIGRMGILRKLPKLLSGSHLDDPVISWFQAQKIRLTSSDSVMVEMDGEIPFDGIHDIELEVLPGVLQVLT